MSKSTAITHVVELTEEEAVALAMISMSPHSGVTELLQPILAVSAALHTADRTLADKQFALWMHLHQPTFTFGG